MVEETKNEKRRHWTPVWVACLLLIGVAAWVSTLLPQPIAKSEGQPQAEEQAKAPYLGVWEGKVARFDGKNAEPQEVYDVAVSSLPEEEQQRLKNGVTWEDEEMLAMLLEAYTS